jgi:hypothetical protein
MGAAMRPPGGLTSVAANQLERLLLDLETGQRGFACPPGAGTSVHVELPLPDGGLAS